MKSKKHSKKHKIIRKSRKVKTVRKPKARKKKIEEISKNLYMGRSEGEPVREWGETNIESFDEIEEEEEPIEIEE